jgi:hypothetical protein
MPVTALVGVDEDRDQNDEQEETGNSQQQPGPYPPVGVFGHAVVSAR